MREHLENIIVSIALSFLFVIIMNFNGVFVSDPVRIELDVGFTATPPPEEPSTPDDMKLYVCSMMPDCLKLAEAGYYEGRSETDEGIIDIFAVIMGRVEHNRFPDTIKEVIEQPRQFSYTHDGSLNRGYEEKEQRRRILLLSYDFLHGIVESDIEALFYHTKDVNPVWNRNMTVVKNDGAHIFYTY